MSVSAQLTKKAAFGPLFRGLNPAKYLKTDFKERFRCCDIRNQRHIVSASADSTYVLDQCLPK
jgi:hypothetical protein